MKTTLFIVVLATAGFCCLTYLLDLRDDIDSNPSLFSTAESDIVQLQLELSYLTADNQRRQPTSSR